jgi:hypothetical protein
MKVNALLDIEISEDDELKITMDYIRKKFEITPDMWIENGKLMKTVYYPGSSYSPDETEIRTATKFDKCVLKVLHELQALRMNEKDI